MGKLPAFATRLNGFATRPELFWTEPNYRPGLPDLLRRAASVPGLGAVDLNYPDHLAGPSAAELKHLLDELGLRLNGFAMRYYSESAFKAGAFSNPDPAVRRRAIELTKRGIDALRAAGGDLMTIWLGQDGFDHPFQADHAALWDLVVAGLGEVAAHDPGCQISIEYKPDEPRACAVLPNAATTLLAIAATGASNLGVTLDFAHALYAGESPAMAAALIMRQSRLMGVHLNDGYGQRDDGLMVGAVHPVQTLELLRTIRRGGYDGCLYFDTFPDVAGLDPVAECAANIGTVGALYRILDRLDASNELAELLLRQDAVAAQRIVQRAMYGDA